jgi:hypothetical protein
MTTDHTFRHEIQWHWVIAGIAAVAVVCELSDSSLVEEPDASKEDAARVASQLIIN